MPNGTSLGEGDGRKRQRNTLACGRCRQRKIKCEDDNGEGCRACRNANLPRCTYLRMNSRTVHEFSMPAPTLESTSAWSLAMPPVNPGSENIVSGRGVSDPRLLLNDYAYPLPNGSLFCSPQPDSYNQAELAPRRPPLAPMPTAPPDFGMAYDDVSPVSTASSQSMSRGEDTSFWSAGGAAESLDIPDPADWNDAFLPYSASQRPSYSTHPSENCFSHPEVSPKTRQVTPPAGLRRYGDRDSFAEHEQSVRYSTNDCPQGRVFSQASAAPMSSQTQLSANICSLSPRQSHDVASSHHHLLPQGSTETIRARMSVYQPIQPANSTDGTTPSIRNLTAISGRGPMSDLRSACDCGPNPLIEAPDRASGSKNSNNGFGNYRQIQPQR